MVVKDDFKFFLDSFFLYELLVVDLGEYFWFFGVGVWLKFGFGVLVGDVFKLFMFLLLFDFGWGFLGCCIFGIGIKNKVNVVIVSLEIFIVVGIIFEVRGFFELVSFWEIGMSDKEKFGKVRVLVINWLIVLIRLNNLIVVKLIIFFGCWCFLGEILLLESVNLCILVFIFCKCSNFGFWLWCLGLDILFRNFWV